MDRCVWPKATSTRNASNLSHYNQMLYACLDTVQKALNAYIKTQRAATDQQVFFTHVLDASSDKDRLSAKSGISMSVVDITTSPGRSTGKQYVARSDGGFLTHNPPLLLELHTLFALHTPGPYHIAEMDYLTLVMAFFQHKPLFQLPQTAHNSHHEAAEISVELMDQPEGLWQRLGVRYRPSVLYKIGAVTIEDALSTDITPAIRDVVIDL